MLEIGGEIVMEGEASAFVFINTKLGAENEVLSKLLEKKEVVKEAYAIYGVYDLATHVTAANFEALKEAVFQLRSIEGVRSTLAMVIIGHLHLIAFFQGQKPALGSFFIII